MRVVVAYPGNGVFAQQVCLALDEVGCLERLATTFAFREQGRVAQVSSLVPLSMHRRLLLELRRRSLPYVPWERVVMRPAWEVVRTVASRLHLDGRIVDRLWDAMAHDFAEFVASRCMSGCDAVYAYEYTAFEAFERAPGQGAARILDVPSPSNRQVRRLMQREREKFPELEAPCDAYLDKLYSKRQQRRDKELDAADVVVTNSCLTAQSLTDDGVDPAKIMSVPLAAPPTIGADRDRGPGASLPLHIVWAGNFNARKGAHYTLEAWRQLPQSAAHNLRLKVFGSVQLPHAMLAHLPDGISLCGTLPQQRLFQEFEAADVLLFPTLSDGFGQVVLEAFSRGLPVITTRQAGAATFVDDKVNGLIIPACDSAAIAEALLWSLDNRGELAAMSVRALETARAWQWPDYRCAFRCALGDGLRAAGYNPDFAFHPLAA